jgi:DNA-binding MarR family transcriptional regulator
MGGPSSAEMNHRVRASEQMRGLTRAPRAREQGSEGDGLTGARRPSAVLPEWRLARRLRDCYRVFNAELQRRLDQHGLRVSDWSHLRIIADEEGLTQVEISKRLRIEKASSTAVLEKLKKAGLIYGKKRQSDFRKLGIYLTPEGRKMVEGLVPEVLSVITLATDSIPPAEMARFVRTIDKIISNIESATQGNSREAAAGT